MTIKVYAVRRDGTIRMVREEIDVDPLEQREDSPRLPACECLQCKGVSR